MRPLSAFLLFLIAGAGYVPAQSAATNAAAQTGAKVPKTATLRVESKLVLVNVVVHDKAGNPVKDLGPKDFTVFDQGHPQTIVQFFAVTAPPPASPMAQSMPTNIFSNRIQQRTGETATATVILLDTLNTTFNNTAYARQQVIKSLRQLQPSDRVALYGLGRRLYILHEFTQSSASLIQALQNYKARPGLDVGVEPDFQSDIFSAPKYEALFGDVDEMTRTFNTERRIDITAGALETIANHLKGFPGRKNLIWVSSGFPIFVGLDLQHPGLVPGYVPQSYSGVVDRAIEALNESSIAVYPVDAEGLPTQSDFTGASSVPSSPFGHNANDRAADISAMGELASRTGGRLYYETNDIKGAIRSAIDDSEVNYTLGYYPDHGKWDGAFREIKVKTDRPGLQVRARAGYFALSDKPLNAKERHQEIEAVAVSPLDDTGMGLMAQAIRKPGANAIAVAIQVDPANVRFDEKGGKRVCALDFFYVQRDKTGTVVNSQDQTVKLNLAPEAYAKGMQHGLFFEKDLTLESKAADVRLIVRDGGSETIGSVTVPLANLPLPAAK